MLYFKDGTEKSIGVYEVIQVDATGALNVAAFGPMEEIICPETISKIINI